MCARAAVLGGRGAGGGDDLEPSCSLNPKPSTPRPPTLGRACVRAQPCSAAAVSAAATIWTRPDNYTLHPVPYTLHPRACAAVLGGNGAGGAGQQERAPKRPRTQQPAAAGGAQQGGGAAAVVGEAGAPAAAAGADGGGSGRLLKCAIM